MDIFAIISCIFLALFTLLILRIIYLLYIIYTTTDCSLDNNEGRTSFPTVFCIGSGGHTTELLRVSRSLNANKYHPRLYITASNDTGSEIKIHELEKEVQGPKKYSISKIPRSRNVNQSFKSAVISTLYALYRTVPIIYRFKPKVILCNGPGTCIPICIVAFLLRCLFLCNCRIVFVESICRVRSLSLTGNFLQYFADVFVVQWPQLRDVCFRAKYFGRLT